MFEGEPNYPDFSRFWQVVDKYQVEIFYAAPTALRALMREGPEWVTKTNRKSLRVLGSVGEPINPEAWEWYYRVVGEARCPIVDTWWQTETGGHMITPLPGLSATTPMVGVEPSEALRQDLIAWVRKEIGPIATPDVIQFAPALPKTRSGKIMRRILREFAEIDSGNLGDISTLADPGVVADLVRNRPAEGSS